MDGLIPKKYNKGYVGSFRYTPSVCLNHVFYAIFVDSLLYFFDKY